MKLLPTLIFLIEEVKCSQCQDYKTLARSVLVREVAWINLRNLRNLRVKDGSARLPLSF